MSIVSTPTNTVGTVGTIGTAGTVTVSKVQMLPEGRRFSAEIECVYFSNQIVFNSYTIQHPNPIQHVGSVQDEVEANIEADRPDPKLLRTRRNKFRCITSSSDASQQANMQVGRGRWG